MLEIAIPGLDTVRAERLVLDVNGTISVDGVLLAGVADRIARLKAYISVTLLTADTFGTAADIAASLGVEMVALAPEDGAAQKLALVRAWGPSRVVAIGNGANDALMLEAAALGMVVLQAEGAAISAWQHADVAFGSICDALDALLSPSRLSATLRK